MYLLDTLFTVLVYSLFVVCIADLNLKAEGELVRSPRYLTNQYSNVVNMSQPILGSFTSTKIEEAYTEDQDWLKDLPALGQVSGVTVDANGLVYIFHRGDRVWGSQTFDNQERLQDNERLRGPIANYTIIVHDPSTRTTVIRWGQNLFYMPHGITVDKDDNVWLTDVGLHQVFKFKALKSNPKIAELSLGESFVPGKDSAHFCKPTSTAVTPWGDFFVADGYCNSRIVKFDKTGVKLIEWGRSDNQRSGISNQPSEYTFLIPHALVIAEDKEVVCTADREHGRVVCYNWHNGTYAFKMSATSVMGLRLFSVSYSPVEGGIFAVVNGPEFYSQYQYQGPKVGGFVFSAKSGKLIFRFGGSLVNPHDITISPDGKTIYACELGPYIVRKFNSNQLFSAFFASNATTTTVKPTIGIHQAEVMKEAIEGSGILPAVLITASALVFAGVLLVAALIYSKARRRGCGRCKSNGWMLGRNSAEGFKLGHFLGQHQGFQKVNTGDESEEDDAEVTPFA
ncbi:peptidyl-alpha-hydroxyglycine alpha-amidating lyase 1 [Nilaparvata lugens]|uniref:peptidyl-alpha-hydroxyglycine alpha-amidating lyase 1 n=1 Tax=Nilaparvata lugens TaxID=108931 RepID=UPI00193CE0EA|nr:peptidyl-alpha-hydroxyglycine alpha-amidating lyase 1 [Nilaparvata lugens]